MKSVPGTNLKSFCLSVKFVPGTSSMRTCGLLAAVMMIGFISSSVAQVPREYDADKYVAPINAPSEIVIAGKDEPGERMIVTGQVTDGTKPLPSVSIYVFHADAQGKYSPECGSCDESARLHGALRTEATGHYRYDTIRPGAYGPPAHVHYVVSAPGYKSRMVELWFEDDPGLAERRARGEPEIPKMFPPGAVSIQPIARDEQGVWHCTRDIKLEHD